MNENDWKLINYLSKQPHPSLREIPLPHVLHSEIGELIYGVDEALQEARTAHHLLDLAGVPRGEGDAGHLDARVLQLMRRGQRLERIETMHQPDRNCDGHGGVSGYCVECGWPWPCVTAEAASGECDEEL